MDNIIVPFEGQNFNAAGICRVYKNARHFIKHARQQFFPGDSAQEAKMSRVYELCREAINEPVPINPEQEEGGE